MSTTRKNTIMGNSNRNLDPEFPETKVKRIKTTRTTSRPYQETDTEAGGMTATGSKTRRTKRDLPTPKTTAKERASRPAYAENTNTLRVQRAKKKDN